jgi:hypothetical protein
MKNETYETSLIYYDRRDELFLVIPNKICEMMKLNPNCSVKFVVDESGKIFIETNTGEM